MPSTLFLITIPLILAILVKTPMPLFPNVKTWSPFKIDALSIVTLLGADAIRKTLGRLEYSPFEYFPLLAGHIFADNSIADPIPGFRMVYEVAVMSEVDMFSTPFEIIDAKSKPKQTVHYGSTLTIAVMLNVFLIVWSVLLNDWYGVAASLSLVSPIMVRVWILWAMRQSLDANVERARSGTESNKVKLFISLPTGDRVTIRTTTGITQGCLLTEARPYSSKSHLVARTIAWIAFGIHVVSLGMACLAVQLVLLTFTLAFSIAAVQGWHSEGWNSNETQMGSRMVIKRYDADGTQTLAKTYAMLDLSDEEEQNLLDWSLIPTRSNMLWLPTFRQFKEDSRHDSSVLDTWGERLRQAYEDDARQNAAGEL
ncbi:Nn.00g095740.m01.CDS01 [Neocucurbitaria sp. VM-36]